MTAQEFEFSDELYELYGLYEAEFPTKNSDSRLLKLFIAWFVELSSHVDENCKKHSAFLKKLEEDQATHAELEQYMRNHFPNYRVSFDFPGNFAELLLELIFHVNTTFRARNPAEFGMVFLDCAEMFLQKKNFTDWDNMSQQFKHALIRVLGPLNVESD